MRCSLFIVSLFFLFATCKKDSSTAHYTSNKVIILVIDGPRYSETWGNDFQLYIPRMKELAKKGATYTNFRNNGDTYTNAGHTAITTGNYQTINNSGKELPFFPSIFQYYNEKYSPQGNSCWIIGSKDKLEVLADCNQDTYNGNYNPLTDCGINGNGSGYRNDSITFVKLLNVLIQKRPALTLVNLKEPDVSGHSGNWNDYIAGIRKSDEYCYQLMNFIETNPFYKGKTTLFVTNDHGRHLDNVRDGFKSHGDGCEGCRHINLFAFGPNIKPDTIFTQPRELIDISTTISKILNFNMTEGKGKVMEELFN